MFTDIPDNANYIIATTNVEHNVIYWVIITDVEFDREAISIEFTPTWIR